MPRLDAFDDLMPVARHLDTRPVRGSGPFGGADEPVLTAWVRLLPAERYREAVAPVLLDALAPSLYAVLPTPVAIPTVDFTVHFTPVRPPVDEGTLHTPDGTLVARSRQLRRVLG